DRPRRRICLNPLWFADARLWRWREKFHARAQTARESAKSRCIPLCEDKDNDREPAPWEGIIVRLPGARVRLYLLRRAISSIGQSTSFTPRGLGVRVPYRPFADAN